MKVLGSHHISDKKFIHGAKLKIFCFATNSDCSLRI